MTPQEIELWKNAIEEICRAWVFGAIVIGIGIGSVSIKSVIGKVER
jgi:hypothetical protein